MAIPLSKRATQLTEFLFDEPLRTRVQESLIELASENIPLCRDYTPEGMDRIRFSIIKLIDQNEKNFEMAFVQARTDWRDLFMAAGFGFDASEHNAWYQDLMDRRDR